MNLALRGEEGLWSMIILLLPRKSIFPSPSPLKLLRPSPKQPRSFQYIFWLWVCSEYLKRDLSTA